ALIESNPATRMKKRGRENALTRTLDDDEIRLFWSKITSPPLLPATGIALKLSLLTGLRAGEVAGIHIATEVLYLDDPEKAVLLIPGERAKNRRPHLVPLSSLARDLVFDAKKLAGESEFLFPARTRQDVAIDPHSLAKAMARFADDLADE